VGGTVGAIITCPLEIVKTRLQSSVASFESTGQGSNGSKSNVPGSNNTSSKSLPHSSQAHHRNHHHQGHNGYHHHHQLGAPGPGGGQRVSSSSYSSTISRRPTLEFWRCLKHIYHSEGPRALFKGLGPNLVGVAPSRAIYFCTYSKVKGLCNQYFTVPDTPWVHFTSAASAGFVSCTLTNPIWFVKTRLQLDQSKYGTQTAWMCIKSIYRKKGIRGFYKGITASYFGISETIINFVIYEYLKTQFNQSDAYVNSHPFVQNLMSAGISKSCASCLTYPHEVARTRLRQEGEKYKRFWQTIFLVLREEGGKGLYRGLGIHLLRAIPNTAIMMAIYDQIVLIL